MSAQLGNIPLTQTLPYDSEVVKLTGSQTIVGVKTFSGGYNLLKLKTTSIERDSPPSSFASSAYLTLDNSGNVLVEDYIAKDTSGTFLKCVKVSPTSSTSDDFKLELNRNGTTGIKSFIATNIDSVKGSAFAAVGMPSSSYVDITDIGSSSNVRTATHSGWINVRINPTEAHINSRLYIWTNSLICIAYPTGAREFDTIVPIGKGMQYDIQWGGNASEIISARFYKSNAEV